MNLRLYHQSTDSDEPTKEKWRNSLGAEDGEEDIKVIDRHLKTWCAR
jgi:hypothetical protein